jgi:23S rRNA pseudouridine1911/1915/1917 synthase
MPMSNTNSVSSTSDNKSIDKELEILFEDNHIIVIDKKSSQLVQGDRTGDDSLSDFVKNYLKVKYNKPGNVFLGVVHRIDRPVSGVVVFAKTSKALTRLNNMFRGSEVSKKYLAVVEGIPPKTEDMLVNHLLRNSDKNKSFVVSPGTPNSKEAKLTYRLLATGKTLSLLEVELLTGRHHQIRCQLANIGCVIKGDVKYGSKRTNGDGSISLHAYSLKFIHPVSKQEVSIISKPLDKDYFKLFCDNILQL